METTDTFLDSVRAASPLVWVGLGVAIVFLALGLRLIFRGSQSRLAAFSSPSGTVLVSKKALQELVKQACALEDWVEAARPIIRLEDEKVSALIELRLASPDNLKDVCERVQARVTELLRKSLSFEHVGSIQIVVKSFGPPRKSSEDAKSRLIAAPLPPSSPLAPPPAPGPIAPTPPAADIEPRPDELR